MKNRSFKLIIFSIKKNAISILLILFTIALIVFSGSNIRATKDGLNLWVKSIIPSLFPFFIATELLSYTNVIPFLGACLTSIMKPLFNVPGIGGFPFIMGIISGYPTRCQNCFRFKK